MAHGLVESLLSAAPDVVQVRDAGFGEFQLYFAAVLGAWGPAEESGGLEAVAEAGDGRRCCGEAAAQGAQVDAGLALDDVHHTGLGGGERRGAEGVAATFPGDFEELQDLADLGHRMGCVLVEGGGGLAHVTLPCGPSCPFRLVDVGSRTDEDMRKKVGPVPVDRPSAVERSLREAAPHEIFDVIRSLIVRRHRAQAVELMMADYAMTRLQPVGVLPRTRPPVSVYDSAPGRAFGAQEAHCVYDRPASTVTVYLPVSVRGDRLGILSVTMRVGEDEELAPAVLENFQEYADALAHEVVVAERDTDLFLQARRAERLTLAAEMQWQLLPGRSCARPEYSLGAQLEPAYAIFGDSFDWSASADDLYVTVSNGMGEGIDAALLTNLAVNALRNARRAGLSLGDQAYLADQAVYGQHRGAQYLSTLLFRFHLPTGDVEIIDAGSPRVWRVRRGVVEPIELEAQMPLGMFEDTAYVPQHFQVEAGDRLLFISDGVYDALSPGGEKYSLRALAASINSTRMLPAAQVPRAMLQELLGHRGSGPAADDSLVMCLDWHGRSVNRDR